MSKTRSSISHKGGAYAVLPMPIAHRAFDTIVLSAIKTFPPEAQGRVFTFSEGRTSRRLPGGDAAFQRKKRRLKFRGGLEPLSWIVIAALEDQGIQRHEIGNIGLVVHPIRQRRKLAAVQPHARLVKHLAKTVDVGRRFAWPFRRHIAFGSDIAAVRAAGARDLRDKTDVRELRNAIDENNVRRLNVTMHQALSV